jgi:hypothetical protein
MSGPADDPVARLKALLADPRRRKNVLFVVVLVIAINLPLVLSTWTSYRVDSAGTDVRAPVTATRMLGTDADPHLWVSWRFPEDVDPDGGTWAAEVDRDTWTAAREAGSVTVRVLEGDPSKHRAAGQVRRYAGLWTTLVADALLALVLLLVWRSRPIRSPEDSEGRA